MAEPESTTLRLEMGYTPVEFERTLAGGFAATTDGMQVTRQAPGAWQVTVPALDLTVHITTHSATPRQLGAMSLPVLDVRLRFVPDDDNRRQTFLDHFWRFFHKGGG